jgi:hypothetical protein
MILYEYIDRHVHVVLLITMIHLIILSNDYEVTQELYFDARKTKIHKKLLIFKNEIQIIDKAFQHYVPDFHRYL